MEPARTMLVLTPNTGLAGSDAAVSGLMASGPQVTLTVAAVARRLGVAPATLRTWDRRYSLGPSEHAAGSHRRYTPLDVARLDVMRRLTLDGISPGEAARIALESDVAPLPLSALSSLDSPSTPRPANSLGGRAVSLRDGTSRGVGGRVIPMANAMPASRGLARAAMQLDAHGCTEIIRETLDARGVVWTWDNLLVPVLVGVGQRWQNTGQGVDVEHLLSECIIGCMRAMAMRLRAPRNTRAVVLACAEEEQHTMPLHVLSAALSERQVGARVLGARVPPDALASAVRRSGPAVLLIWAHLSSTGDIHQLEQLPTMRPAPMVLAGGPGWPAELPDGVVRVLDLTDAITRIANAVGA